MNAKPLSSSFVAIVTLAVAALLLSPPALMHAQGQVGQVVFSGYALTCEDAYPQGIPGVRLLLQIHTNVGNWQTVDTTLTNTNGAFTLSYAPSDSSQNTYRVIENASYPSCTLDTDLRVFYRIQPGYTHSGITFRDQWSTPTPTRTSTESPVITASVTAHPTHTKTPTRTWTPTAPLTIRPTETRTATNTGTATATQLVRLQLPLICKAYPQTWQRIGLADEAIKSLAIDPSNTQFLHAGTSHGLWRRFYCNGDWYETTLPAAGVYAIAAAQAPSGHLFVGTWGNGVYRSVDAGVTWNAVNEGLSCPRINALAISPNYAVDETVYAGTNTEGVYRSQDGGLGWQAINEGLTNLEILSLTIHPQNPQLLFAGTFGQGVFRSDDGGASWTRCPIGNDLIWCIAVSPSHPNVVYAGTDGGVFRSNNEGLNWTPTTLGFKTYALAIDPRNPLQVYAGTSGSGVHYTSLGGLGWSAMSDGLSSRVIQTLALDIESCNTLFAGTDDGLWAWTLD